MSKTVFLYARLLALFVLVMSIVAFNFAVWGRHRHPAPPVLFMPDADAERGAALIRHYGCGACHLVPEISGAVGRVGPPLDQFLHQSYVAGILPHTPQNAVDWIRAPKRIDPQTAMPDLAVSEQDARDIVAYLYQLP